MKKYPLITRLGLQRYAPSGALDKEKWVVDIDELEQILANGLERKSGNYNEIVLKLDPINTPVSINEILDLFEHIRINAGKILPERNPTIEDLNLRITKHGIQD